MTPAILTASEITAASGLVLVLASMGYGVYLTCRSVRRFLRSSWRRIPTKPSYWAVGRGQSEWSGKR